MIAKNARREFRLGPWLVRPHEGLISRDGDVRHIEPKAMSVLEVLVEGNGATVSRAELLDAVWPNQEVSDDVLTGCVSALRRALGDDRRKHRYIETIPKKGYRLVVPVRSSGAETATDNGPAPAVRASRWRWASPSVLILILVFGSWWLWRTEPGVEVAKAPERSIAVLPFDVFSDRSDLVHFASGLEEELIHQLAADPSLHVIARTSSARIVDSNLSLREISNRLGVRHVIEGSVRATPDGMRITVQLIDAETDAHLWSEVFDAGQVNLIRVQEEVGEAVARLLASHGLSEQAFTGTRIQRPARNRHPVPEAAYRLYLMGEAHMRVGSAEAYFKASEYFSDALSIAPSYALAWSRLAAAYLLRHQYAGLPLEEASRRAGRALDRALELAPEQPEALATFGLMYTYLGNYPQAEAYFQRALARQPNLRFALHNYGFALWSQGEFEAALDPLGEATRIDPLSGVTLFLLADSLAGMGDFDGAMGQYRHCMMVLPEYPACALGLSTLHRLMGDYQRASKSLEQAATLTQDDNFWLLLSSGLLAIPLGQLDTAERFLERAQEIFPQNYTLLRGQLQLSLATNTLDAFLDGLEQQTMDGETDRDLGLIGGLAWFHAGDCVRAIASYRPHLDEIQPNRVNIWDVEAGFSHAVALAWCHGKLGNRERRDDAMAALREYVEHLPATPIFGQRYLAASYAQLSGRSIEALEELDRLREDGWPLLWISERQPVFLDPSGSRN